MVLSLTLRNFDVEINSVKPVAIKFFSLWNKASRDFEDVFKMLETDIPEMKFTEVNIDSNPEIRKKYGVIETPVILILNNREVVAHVDASNTRRTIKEELKLISRKLKEKQI
jgi:thioredoxin-like negative regulator of GroEL